MLPEKISNDLCSLREKEDRPALAVTMIFDKFGQKISHKFARIIMRSAAKLSYEEAQAAIDGKPSAKAEPLVRDVLQPLWAAYACMMKGRATRGPLELDLPERKILLDSKGMVTRVVVPPRLDAHKLIEEFMIQANVAAAEELEAKRTPLLYRLHDEPSAEKLRALSEYLKTVGLSLALGQVMRPKHFNQLLVKVQGEDYQNLVNEIVLRTQAQAVYSPENRGHFGLALKRYAHFTSPIRRYADLIVHRALVSALGFGDDGISTEDIANLAETAEMISTAERRSMAAERETNDRLIAHFLSGQTGATFAGRIGGVVGAGLFIKLDDTGADGFVPVSSLGSDYFVFNEVQHSLAGQRTGETFQLGDKVQVKLIEATPLQGGLRFEMVSEGRKGQPLPGGRRRTTKLSRQTPKSKKRR
jgi:ribonuclease R